jgi:MraZ protein
MDHRMDMFIGQHKLELSENRSFVIPEEFRALLADGLFVTRGFEKNLLLMSEAVFKGIYQRIASLNIADSQARLLQRLIVSNAARLAVDANGSIRIPEDLSTVTGLQDDIMLVGQGDYAEVWSSAAWRDQSNTLLDTEANAQRFAHIDLALK